jgi:hypothetical protein
MSPAPRSRSPRVILAVVVLVGIALATALAIVLTGPSAAGTSTGTVVHPVATKFVPDATQVSDCGEETCFRQAFGNIAFRHGPKDALALVEKLYEGGSPACHGVVHTIGAATLTRNGGDVARTFAEGSSLCWSGYYHGILERSLLDVGSSRPVALRAVSQTLCDEVIERETPWVAYQCLHGLGHGLMISTALDLPASLDTCRRLSTRWKREVCRSGVFMENVWPAFGVSPWLRDDEPLYPCTAVAREARARCYQMATTRILGLVDGDWSETARLCSTVEGSFASWCFRSFGRDASGNSGRDIEETIETCALTRPYSGEHDCVYAAAQDVTANYTSGSRAGRLCERVRHDLLEPCFEGIGSVMAGFRRDPDARAQDCSEVAPNAALSEACERGGRRALPRA